MSQLGGGGGCGGLANAHGAQINFGDLIPYLTYDLYLFRVGEHPNTAFGLAFAIDYSRLVEDLELGNFLTFESLPFFILFVHPFNIDQRKVRGSGR